METSNFLKLNLHDLAKGLVVAVLVVVLELFLTALKTQGLEGFAAIDWAQTLDLAIKAAGAYLLKNLFSDRDGKVLGKI